MTNRHISYRSEVPPAWIDRNGHLNVGYFMVAFDEATTRFFELCGLDDAHRRQYAVATFTIESHATYERELLEGDPFVVTTQLLEWNDRKVHYYHEMNHESEGYLAATNELISLQVDTAERRSVRFADPILRNFDRLRPDGEHRPSRIGRVMGVDARRPG
ncbi:MAG: thioesterase family protein [Acidobacteriota bacterium]|nr:thioesterase family protein [Acidobacteriota bacterium]